MPMRNMLLCVRHVAHAFDSPRRARTASARWRLVMCHSHWAQRRAAAAFRHLQHHGFGHGPAGEGWGWGEHSMHPGEEGGGFGVRRPLRFLIYKLGLDDLQMGQLAKILDELKTERAQIAVDDRRTLSDFADALSGDAFDAAKVAAGGDRRV